MKNGRILNLLTPGESFGEMAVIGKGPLPSAERA